MSADRWLYILRSAPYSSPRFAEAIDAALVAAVFEQPITLLLMDEAVNALRPNQDGGPAGTRTAGKHITALPEYDVDEIYCCAASLARYGVDPNQSPVPVQVIDTVGQAGLIAGSRVVLSD